MSTQEMDNKIRALRELRRMADELQGEIDAITDTIKAEMTARSVDEISGTDWRASWKTVTSRRFDSKAFQRTHGELYGQYCTESTSRRFIVA